MNEFISSLTPKQLISIVSDFKQLVDFLAEIVDFPTDTDTLLRLLAAKKVAPSTDVDNQIKQVYKKISTHQKVIQSLSFKGDHLKRLIARFAMLESEHNKRQVQARTIAEYVHQVCTRYANKDKASAS